MISVKGQLYRPTLCGALGISLGILDHAHPTAQTPKQEVGARHAFGLLVGEIGQLLSGHSSIYKAMLQLSYLEMMQAWKQGRECWGWGRAGGRHCLYTKPRWKPLLTLAYPAVCVKCVTCTIVSTNGAIPSHWIWLVTAVWDCKKLSACA